MGLFVVLHTTPIHEFANLTKLSIFDIPQESHDADTEEEAWTQTEDQTDCLASGTSSGACASKYGTCASKGED